jgi:hypothetical protein
MMDRRRRTMPRARRTPLSIAGTLTAIAMLGACGSDNSPAAKTDLQAFLPALAAPVDGAPLPPLPDAQPLLADAGSAPLGIAPAAQRLPAAPMLGWSDPGDQGYAWLDRADTLFDVIGDAPPDYGFDYAGGVEPWGWDALDGHSMFAEPIDGGYRQYFYEPGGVDPFFVRDPWNGYGFSDGRVVSVFDRGGGILPLATAGALLPVASGYFARGRDLRRVSYRQPRRGVAAPRWAERQPYFTRARQQWAVARDRQPRWSEWRARRGVEARPRVRYEREARRGAARQFADWRGREFRGEPPRLYDQRRDRRAARDDRRARRDVAAIREERRGGRSAERGRAPLAEERARGRAVERRAERSREVRDERRAQARQQVRGDARADRARESRQAAQRRQTAARQQERLPPFAQERAQRRTAAESRSRPTREARAERPQRAREAQRPQREVRGNPARMERRAERPQRVERVQRRAERPQRVERVQRRAERPQRVERVQRRAERPQRVERVQRRAERPQRVERVQRRAERPQQVERVQRQAQRPQREARGERRQVARADTRGSGERRGGGGRRER